MTTKKAVTMIYKHLNFKNDKFGKAKLFKSVAHSLRIAPNENNQIISTKILEWNEDKSDENLVWFPSITGKNTIKLNELTEEQKAIIQESFIHKVNAEQKSKNEKSDATDALSKYKAKVNKWHNSITDNNDALKIYLAKILEKKESFNINEEVEQLSEFDFSRKNQKTETVRKFLNLHNEVIENKSDIAHNKVFIQEAFFKIPMHNKVNIKPLDMLSNIHSFYSKNFPDYPVKLVVFHGDEVGNHPHIFVEAKNKNTGKYDLLNAQKQFVNDNIEKVKQQYPDAETLDFSNRSYKSKKLQAQYFQTLFYQHTNNMLLKYNVEAKKLDNTEEHKKRMKLIEEDAKKPKIERIASFHNKQILDLNDELSKIKVDIKNDEDIQKALNNSIIEDQKIHQAFISSIAEKQDEEENLDVKIDNKRTIFEKLNSDIQRIKDELLDFSNLIIERVIDIFSNSEQNKSLDKKIAGKYESFEDKAPADNLLDKISVNLKTKKKLNEDIEFEKLKKYYRSGKVKI